LETEWSAFRYSYQGNGDATEVARRIEAELNGGYAFSHHRGHEEMIETPSSGEPVSIAICEDDTISLRVSPEAFRGSGPTELLTQCWGNLLDFGRLRLEDFTLRHDLAEKLAVKTNTHEPLIRRLRRTLGIPGYQPLLGTVLKESQHLSPSNRAALTAEYIAHGVHIVKEDETYMPGNADVLRDVKVILGSLDQERGLYVPNLSGCSLDQSLLDGLIHAGIKIVMINIWLTGWNWAAELRRRCRSIGVWFHRVGYESLAPTIGMVPFMKCARLAGSSFVHVGTPFLDSDSEIEKTSNRIDALKDTSMDSTSAPPIPILSKTTTDTVGELACRFGPDVCVMACGEFREKREIVWERVRDWVNAAQAGRTK
jgi:ribulose 1,5-bisphosphate carboxylase large subunit-like protein